MTRLVRINLRLGDIEGSTTQLNEKLFNGRTTKQLAGVLLKDLFAEPESDRLELEESCV